MQTVSIFMTKYDDVLSNFIYWISGCGYTHVAVAFDKESQNFYTFNYKGFRREHPFKRKRRYGKSICYKIEVQKEQYIRLRDIIIYMENCQVEWKYSLFGVVLCILGIKHRIRNSYYQVLRWSKKMGLSH